MLRTKWPLSMLESYAADKTIKNIERIVSGDRAPYSLLKIWELRKDRPGGTDSSAATTLSLTESQRPSPKRSVNSHREWST